MGQNAKRGSGEKLKIPATPSCFCFSPCQLSAFKEASAQLWPGERVLLERIARLQKPRVVVWRGSGIPSDQQGTVVLHAQAHTHDENIWQCLGRILQTAQCRVVVGGFGPQKNASVCFLGKLGKLFSNDFGETSSSGRPIGQPTRGSRSHTHLSPPVNSGSLFHPLEGRWARPETRELDQFEFGKSRVAARSGIQS